MARQCKAAESCSLEEALARLPRAEDHARSMLPRLMLLGGLPGGARILDVGAAQGRFLVGCAKMGFQAVGVEPWDEALAVAPRLAEHQGVSIEVVKGYAEELPFEDEQFDLVHASSVLEHVRDAQACFAEAYRVLKPGGLLWFGTASSMCPRQSEIRGFPAFGWYPNRLKLRIMKWAMENKPHLIGHTEMPAIHWFTPWKARRMLRQAGFSRVYDRWDMPILPGERKLKRLGYAIIRSTFLTKCLADMLKPGCAYTGVK